MPSNSKSDISTLLQLIDSTASILTTDTAGKILSVNQNFCDLTGYSKGELLGKNPRMFNSGVHTKEFFSEMWKTVLAGQTWRGNICNRRKDGTHFWVDTLISPMPDSTNQVTRFLVLRFDVTRHLESQKKVEEQEQLLITASKLSIMGEMAGFMAHEINNPLSTLLLLSDRLSLIINNPTPSREELVATANKIGKISKTLIRIAAGMRDLARDESEFEMEPVALKSLIEDVTELFGNYVKKSGVHWEIDLKEEGTLLIKCHRVQIGQILVNLIKNACDAIADHESKWIRLNAYCSEGFVHIRIEDSGKGIPDAIADRLFKTQFTTKAHGKGTGLGLNVSRRIAVAHGGDLYLDRKSQQTCFVLKLPLQPKIS